MNINAGYEIASKARIIHQIQLIRGITQNLHAKGELWHQSAVDGLMKLCVYLKKWRSRGDQSDSAWE